jgi:hypothetical protein
MKINFRKISAIAASALMTGMTLGVAAAANYPAPFVSGGTANVAVVYGTGAGVSQLDLVQAGNIQDSLGTYVSGGTVTVEGGESFVLEKSSDKFNFNEALNGVYADLDDAEMDFLADGTYDSGDIDEDYTQLINLSDKTLSLFADNDYNDKAPTIGFRWTNNEPILEYEIEFDNAIPFVDLEDTEMPLMGNMYYVLNVLTTNNTIELLDSAEKVILSEGDTVTVGDKTVSIEYIDENEVKFNVDGEITDKMSDHEYEELNDGSYIIANEVMYASKESGVSKVEFSIGAGKVALINGAEVEVNDEAVDGLTTTFTKESTTGLTKLNFAWASDDETYLTEEDAITMPTFETIKLVFGGLDFPTESETVSLENGETLTLAMENYELPLMWWDGASALLGEEGNLLKLVAANNATIYNSSTVALTGGIELAEDGRFLVTSMDTDLSDIETVYYELSNVDYNSDIDFEVTLKDLSSANNDLTFDSLEAQDVGDVTITLAGVNADDAYFTFTTAGTKALNKAVSDTGLVVTLPTTVASLSTSTAATITFQEANADGDIGQGTVFTVDVKATDSDKIHVSSITHANVTSQEADDVYTGYVLSDLASKITYDTSGDENTYEINYYGSEVTGQVMVVAGGTVSGGETTLGNVLVKDSEVSSVATKNLIVVGGSCINSAAAALVGGAKCGAAWTTATGIGSGQFLIKGYADSTITTALALLVAGYDAEDTVKATTYLTNKPVDTSKAYKGTTTTETAVVID